MAGRYKPLFYIILSITIVWFIIIFLCLPQIDNNSDSLPLEQQQLPWTLPLQAPSSLDDMQSRDSKKHYRKSKSDSNQQIIEPPKSLDFMKYFHKYGSKNYKQISTVDTLFYEFNPNPNQTNFNNYDYLSKLVTKEQHESDTIELGNINNLIDKYVKAEGYKLFAFNLLVSNRIGLFRSIPDTRNPKCPLKNIKYHELSQIKLSNKLKANHSLNSPPSFENIKEDQLIEPKFQNITSNIETKESNESKINLKASIVICYYNEAPSALLRTIFTIIKRSPLELIEEIIIVDDYSEQEYSYEKIKPFVDLNLIKVVRTNKRQGLIRARLFGANLTKGHVLIFLDSHVEANVGWLEPLLETIQLNKTTIACPMIDLINHETLIYSASPMVKGGLNWALNFKWDSVPSNKLKTYDDFIKPIDSPTLAGGLYAIQRDYFFELGSYDSGMNLWGGENVELSLRAWMCGGRIVILPCSRLGHIFRKRRPYGPEANEPDSLLYNSHRTARVWLDEKRYLEKFYESNSNARNLQSGDVIERIKLKKTLNCNNFTWFLDNIYPTLKDNHVISSPSTFLKNDNRLNSIYTQRTKERSQKKEYNNHRRYRNSRWDHLDGDVSISNNRLQREVSYFNNDNNPLRQLKPKMPLFINSNNGSKEINNLIDDDDIFFHRTKSNNIHSRNNNIFSNLPKIINQFQIQSINSNLCIESRGSYLTKSFKRLILNECAKVNWNKEGKLALKENRILYNQLWSETEFHDYRLGDNQCLDLTKNLPLTRKCHNMGSFQDWKYDINETHNTNIYNSGGDLCLGVEKVQIGEPIIVIICDKMNLKNNDKNLQQRHQTTESINGQVNSGNNNQYRYSNQRNKKTHLANKRSKSQYYHQHHLVQTISSGVVGSFKPNQRWNLIYLTNKTHSSL